MGDIQNELRRKGRIELGDKVILYAGEWMLLQQGDTYIGQAGNDTPEILTMRRREVQKRRRGDAVGKIFPKERKKPLYDLHEVVKVTIIDNPNPPKENHARAPEPDRDSEDAPARGDRPPAVPRAHRPGPSRGGRTNYAGAAKPSDPRGSSDGGRNGR